MPVPGANRDRPFPGFDGRPDPIGLVFGQAAFGQCGADPVAGNLSPGGFQVFDGDSECVRECGNGGGAALLGAIADLRG